MSEGKVEVTVADSQFRVTIRIPVGIVYSKLRVSIKIGPGLWLRRKLCDTWRFKSLVGVNL